MEDQAAGHRGADRVDLERERGHHPEVATPAAMRPQQLGVLVLGRQHPLAVGGDELDPDEVVAGEAVLAHQPADAAAERETADAGGGDEPAGGGQPVGLGLVIDVPPQGPTARVCPAGLRLDPYPLHLREVDDEAAVTGREPGDAVPAAANCDG